MQVVVRIAILTDDGEQIMGAEHVEMTINTDPDANIERTQALMDKLCERTREAMKEQYLTLREDAARTS